MESEHKIKCIKCDFSFQSQCKLEKHVYLAHPVKFQPIKRYMCKKTFSDKRKLTEHKKLTINNLEIVQKI